MKLSPKEQECYNHAIKLKRNKEIAIAMNISEKGVKFHLANIFKKLGVKNKIELFALAAKLKPRKQKSLIAGLSPSLDLYN